MSFQEVKSEPLEEEVEGAQRANDFANIVFDYEVENKIPLKLETKEEIKSEPLSGDNVDADSHVIDVENDQEKIHLQAMLDKLLIEKQTLQKDMEKFVELLEENQILKSEKRQLEDKVKKFEELQVKNQKLKSEKDYVQRQLEDHVQKFEELQVKNQNLKSDKNYMERQLEENKKKFQELKYCAQLQITILNSNENEDKNSINPPKKLNKSDVTQKLENSEPDIFQAEEFNIPDPMVSSNCSNSGATQITLEQLAIPNSDNDSSEVSKKELKKVRKSVTCDICGKSFFHSNQKFDLSRHKRNVHEGIRFPCEQCGQQFTQKYTLKAHVLGVHERIKRFKCDSCGKLFSRAGQLKTHINVVHNGQKDHKCDSCGKVISQARNMRAHINVVHNGQTHRT